jgi:beta-phosphoglucomutase-like phosphatase (HAD superfamily)
MRLELRFAAQIDRRWTEADRAAIMGSNTREWSSRMKVRLDLDMSEREIERAVIGRMLERYEREGPPAIGAAAEVVRRLAERYPLGVASSSPPANPPRTSTCLRPNGSGWIRPAVS